MTCGDFHKPPCPLDVTSFPVETWKMIATGPKVPNDDGGGGDVRVCVRPRVRACVRVRARVHPCARNNVTVCPNSSNYPLFDMQ